MEQNNKKFYIIIAALCSVITLLIGLIAGMFINIRLPQREVVSQAPVTNQANSGISSNAGNTANQGNIEGNTNTPENGNLAGGSGNLTAISNSSGSTSIRSGLVYSGYEFTIPDEYGVLFESYGPVVYMKDIFQVRLVVKEESTADFKAYYNNPNDLTLKARDAGWTITQDCKVYTIDGKDYFVFVGESDGEKYMVFRTQLDDNNIFAGNMYMESSSTSDDDYRNIFANLATNAVKSDKPDTTEEEYNNIKYSVNVGEEVSEGSLTTSKVSVDYKVPEGFYFSYSSNMDDEDMLFCYSEYMTNNYDTADITISEYEAGAKEYVADNGSYEGCKVLSVEKYGHTFYYAVKNAPEGEFYSQKMVFATDLKVSGLIYKIEIYADDSTEKGFYNSDSLDGFFNIIEK